MQPTNTNPFKAWFKNSKVVNLRKEPLKVFHVTHNDFDTFNAEPRDIGGVRSIIDSIGAWFAGNPVLANDVYDFYLKRRTGQPRTIPCYLSIQNPLNVDHRGNMEDIIISKIFKNNKIAGNNFKDELENSLEAVKYAKTKLIELGYDGIHIHDDSKIGDSWIIFNSNQVKSAIGNKGAFNKEDPRITESIRQNYPSVVYHGTTEKNAQNILTKGLTLNYSKFGSKEICASDNKELALRWSTQRTKELLDWEPEKCLPDVKVALFAIDGSYFQKSSDGIYISTTSIPEMALKELEMYRLGDLPKFPLSSNEWTEPTPVKVIKLHEAIHKSNQLFSFMTESKAFRNEAMVEKYTTKELSEILFAMMLAVHLMDGRDQMKQYCRNSLRFPKFDHIFLSSTDLSNVISTLRNARKYLDQQNVDVPMNELKRYLRGVILGNNTPEFCRAFFMHLQSRLRIKDASLLILRRQIVDGEAYGRDDVSLGRPLYEYLRRYQNKCDMLPILQLLMDGPLSESVIIERIHTKEDAILLIAKLKEKGINTKLIGSVNMEGQSNHDIDLLLVSFNTKEKILTAAKAIGLAFVGNSWVSPEEAEEAGKEFYKGWSEILHFEYGDYIPEVGTQKIEIWMPNDEPKTQKLSMLEELQNQLLAK